MTIGEASDSFSSFARGFSEEVMDEMKAKSGEIVGIIQQQLMVGLDGNDNPLRPSYLSDPWFQTEEAGHWRGRAKAYMLWKKSITEPRPSPSWLGYPARSVNTPNLFITGKFHQSLKAVPADERLVFVTEGTPFGDDVVAKYGQDILRVGQKGVNYIVQSWVRPRLEIYMKKYGLL